MIRGMKTTPYLPTQTNYFSLIAQLCIAQKGINYFLSFIMQTNECITNLPIRGWQVPFNW